jgi:hypothetical protein
VSEQTEEIYRRPGAPAGQPPTASSSGTGHEATPRPAGGTAEEPAPAKPRSAADEPEPTAIPRRAPASVEPPRLPLRIRARTAAVHAGENLLVDLVLDLVLAKFQQWRNDAKLRDRLAQLQPKVDEMKQQAFDALQRDPGTRGTTGWYYNIYIRIVSTTTTVIAGGRAVVIPGSPRPEIVKMETTKDKRSEVLSHDDAVKLFSVAEGATGAVYQHSDLQVVVYSEPVEYE